MKKKLLFLASIDVAPTGGGPIQFHRHFVERTDFDFEKIIEPSSKAFPQHLHTGIAWLDKIICRLAHTRLFSFFCALDYWIGARRIAKDLTAQVAQHRPDAIVTVAFGIYGFAAWRVAKKLRLPLITFLHDWWPDLVFKEKFPRWLLDHEMQALYRYSQLNLSVSKGMDIASGSHSHTHRLYPIPRKLTHTASPAVQSPSSPTLLYLGGMTQGYGRLLASLCRHYTQLDPTPKWKLRLHGENAKWPEADRILAQESGIYQGPKYGEEAEAAVAAADLLLVVMDFEEESRRRVTTSFPSKLLDICQHGKPIIIWAPPYASAAEFSKENQFGLLVTNPDPQALCQAVDRLISNPEKIAHLSQQATQWASGEFNADHIHSVCITHIHKTINTYLSKL
jgi:UDP-N-acetylglucosamine:LPS N-acetylglucosamine transferase